MTSNYMDIDEIGILNEIGISTRLESEFDSPSQFVIENELRSELVSLPRSSDTISITQEDNVSTYIQLTNIISSDQTTEVVLSPVTTIESTASISQPRLKRKRRTKAVMAAFRVIIIKNILKELIIILF